MKAVISKWGNSPALRLPAAVMKDAAFSLHQQVNITVTRGRIVIEPAETLEFNLEKLVAGISQRIPTRRSYSAGRSAKKPCDGAPGLRSGSRGRGVAGV